jgi:hypothetical protein
MKSFNSHCFSHPWLGVGMALVAAVAAQAQTAVTFQIDMSTETSTPTIVYISGIFNGWPAPGATTNGGNPVTNNILLNVGGTIWSNTFIITDPPGTIESCKFQDDVSGWENVPANRQFVLGTGTQVQPLTIWDNSNWPAPTNEVTFQLDMNAQVLTGAYIPGQAGQTLTVSGDFENLPNGYGDGLPLTNNPTLPGTLSNIYTGTFPVVGFPGGTSISYKFRENGGWETPSSTGGNNRSAAITNSTQVLPLVFYNDASTSDLVLTPTAVTFSVYVPDGTALANGGTFTKGVDNIAINGDWLGWWGWGVNAAPAEDIMTEVGSSDIYTNTLIIPKGNVLNLTYKYGIDGLDNENGSQTNHIRYIRSYGPTYAFPQDTWSWIVCPPGTAYPNPGITSTNIVEPSFGYLTIQPATGGTLPITWLGRPAVLLQSSPSLSGGAWTDVIGTDGTQATNMPNGGGNQFFRLKKNP